MTVNHLYNNNANNINYMTRIYVAWLVVFVSLFINHAFLKNPDFRQSISLIQAIRYSDFLVQKWFLVIIVFGFFIWWLKGQKGLLNKVKKNANYLLLIALFTIVAHWFSFQRWFEFDDYRLIGHHRAVSDTLQYNTMGALNNPYYGYAFAYLVVRWFDVSFEYYNSLGLVVLFLIGVLIFAIITKISKQRFIALSVALLFVTSPGYYRQILQMHEFLGDGFPLLQFMLASFWLISGFFPGAVIAAASAMEFGLSREHFIALPLVLMALFFAPRYALNKKQWMLAVVSFPLISLLYIPVLMTYPPEIINRGNWLSNWPQLVRISDSIFGISIPQLVSYPIIAVFRFLFPSLWISAVMGFLIIFLILVAALYFLFKKQNRTAALFLIGVSILGGSIAFPTLMGIRLVHDLKLLAFQYSDFIPAAPTSYGLPATVGVSFIIAGIGLSLKKLIFIPFVVIFILVNSFSTIKGDQEWIKLFSRPQRISNQQLEAIIPADGKIKVIYGHELLPRYISYFYQLYRIKEPLYFTNDATEFLKLLEKYSPDREHVYLLTIENNTYRINDLSRLLRFYYPERVSAETIDKIIYLTR